MAFPLLKRLRTHYGRHCKPFSRQKCTRLQDIIYTISKIFMGVILQTPAETPQVLGPWYQFQLGSLAFPLFLFYEMTTAGREESFSAVLTWTQFGRISGFPCQTWIQGLELFNTQNSLSCVLVNHRRPWKVWNLARANETSMGSRLKFDVSCWNVYC